MTLVTEHTMFGAEYIYSSEQDVASDVKVSLKDTGGWWIGSAWASPGDCSTSTTATLPMMPLTPRTTDGYAGQGT